MEIWVASGTDQPTPAALARKNSLEAGAEAKSAGAALSNARADDLMQTNAARLKELAARAGMENAHADLFRAIEKTKGVAPSGDLKEADRRQLEKAIVTAQQSIAKSETDPLVNLTPQAKQAHQDFVAATKQQIALWQQRLAAKPAGGVSAFRSPEDVRAAYRSGKLTRDQAKAEIQRLGGLKPAAPAAPAAEDEGEQ